MRPIFALLSSSPSPIYLSRIGRRFLFRPISPMAFLLPLTDATSLPAAKAPLPRRTSPDPGRTLRRSACARGGVKDEAKERVIRVSDPLRERGLLPPPLLSVPLIAGASSASPPSPSVTPQQQRDDGDERHSYYVNMGYAIRTLREDFPDTFQREPNFDIFRFVIPLVPWLLLVILSSFRLTF